MERSLIRVATVVANHALGLAGRAEGVEDVERIGCCHRNTVVGIGRGHCFIPIEIASSDKGAGFRLKIRSLRQYWLSKYATDFRNPALITYRHLFFIQPGHVTATGS